MDSAHKTRMVWISTVICVIVGFLCFTGWLVLRPKIGHASLAEIEAVLPPDLQGDRTVDEAAARRMDRIHALAAKLESSTSAELLDIKTPVDKRTAAARTLWNDNQAVFREIGLLLDVGPLEYRPIKNPDQPREFYSHDKNLVKCLAQSGMILCQQGDFTNGGKAIDLSYRLSDAMFHGNGDELGYLVGVALKSISVRAIEETARIPSCPAELCRHWLVMLGPTEFQDAVLQKAIREEFRDSVIPRLANPESLPAKMMAEMTVAESDADSVDSVEPKKTDEKFGTFDPLVSSRLLGQICEFNIQNTKQPLSSYDGTYDRRAELETKGLPENKGAGKSGLEAKWEHAKFRFIMNNTSNSLGRAMIALGAGGMGKSNVSKSCRRRANEAAVRVLLASVLYRRDHGGKLPYSINELVPKYLPTLPVDPYNGNAMLYSAAKEKVWSVGDNLVDDGGAISFPEGRKDVGVLLSLLPK